MAAFFWWREHFNIRDEEASVAQWWLQPGIQTWPKAWRYSKLLFIIVYLVVIGVIYVGLSWTRHHNNPFPGYIMTALAIGSIILMYRYYLHKRNAI